MDEEYNPTDKELYALFGEEPPNREEETPDARADIPQVDPFLEEMPPPGYEHWPEWALHDPATDEPLPTEPPPGYLSMADLPPFDDNPFSEPEPARGTWAQPPTIYIGRNNMPPGAEKPSPDTPADKEPRIGGLLPGTHVTVTGYVFAIVDEENQNPNGKYEKWRFHRTVWKTECRVVRCLFLGWTQMQGGWREPGYESGGMDYNEYTPPQFDADKYVNVAVVMPLDLHDKSKFRKPFRCLPSHIIVESALDYLLHLSERNRKFNQ